MAKHFSIDARALLTWGRESIKDHTTAVLELVKNSYDANATIVQVDIKVSNPLESEGFIRIADNGVGMSVADVERNWLRLGFSEKREQRFTARGRRKTGEKGIGRVSADRLGAMLDLRSQAKGEVPAGLRVNWREFELPGHDLQDIPIEELSDVDFQVPRPSKWNEERESFSEAPSSVPNSHQRTGTELIIRSLRQPWRSEDVQELRRLLSLLTPPFERVEDFQIRIENDVDEACNGVVSSPLMASAAIEGRFSLSKEGQVDGELIYRAARSRRRTSQSISMPFEQLVHPKIRRDQSNLFPDRAETLGPVKARLLFFPQKAETVRGLDLGLSDLREFLMSNGGVRVYRDNIRVPPYGDQGRAEGDWLALGDRKARNPAGPTRPDFRVSPYQLVGAVFIGRDSNPGLVDTSGREGLVAGEPFSTLKSFLIGCLTQLEAQYHKLFLASAENAEHVVSPRDTVDDLRAHLSEVAETIKRTEEKLPPPISKQMSRVVEQLASAGEKLKLAEKAFDELASQAATSRTLATIGIAAATFGHETQRGLDSMRATLEVARLLLKNGENPDDVVSEIEKAILESDRVSAWGAFALGRVRRDKRVRRLANVSAIVGAVLDEIVPAMEASSITVSRDLDEIKAKVFAMDIECVVINLLTNAYYFSKQSKRDRRVAVRVKGRSVEGRDGFELVVSDSGPGVSNAVRERIWDPLFTTKTDDHGQAVGTGLGLALVSAVVQDTEGARAVDADPRLGGARFNIWLPDAGK